MLRNCDSRIMPYLSFDLSRWYWRVSEIGYVQLVRKRFFEAAYNVSFAYIALFFKVANNEHVRSAPRRNLQDVEIQFSRIQRKLSIRADSADPSSVPLRRHRLRAIVLSTPLISTYINQQIFISSS
jgi:hypothetical protein